MVTTREHIENLHKTGALKKVGTVTLADGTKLSGNDLKERLVDTAKKHASLRTLRDSLGDEFSGISWQKKQKLQKLLREDESQKETKRTAGGWLGFGKKKEDDTKVPWYRRAKRLEDEKYPKTGVSISQHRQSGVSQVSVDTTAQGGRKDKKINPLTGQPTSGGINRSGPSVGAPSGDNNEGGGPPMPLAR